MVSLYICNRDIFEAEETTKQIFVKLHGFEDSPVPLCNTSQSMNLKKIRVNEENYISMCCVKSETKQPIVENAYFSEFNEHFSIKSIK